jgi:ABC-type polysaccharide/polyol phosphate export permease
MRMCPACPRVAAMVVVLGLFMGYRPHGGAPGVLAAVALVVAFGLSLSWLWASVALLVRDPAVVTSIANVVLMPLSFASNVFVQPRTMPGWLQAFVNVNPISHIATAARDLMNKHWRHRRSGRVVPHRHRRHHPRVRANHPAPLRQAGMTNGSKNGRQRKHRRPL